MTFEDYIKHSTGTYFALQPSGPSRIGIESLVRQLGLKAPVNPVSYHCTVLYSKKPCPEIIREDFDMPIWAEGYEYEIFEGEKPALVLKLRSIRLHELYKHLTETYGATSDFPTYIPHITLTYDEVPEVIPEHPVTLNIKFDSYVITPIKE